MAGIAVMKDSVKFYMDETDITTTSKIGNLASIGDIGGEAEEIDTTTIDSEAREFVTGFTDEGSIELTMNITDKDGYTKMVGFKDSGAQVNWGLSVQDSTTKTQLFGLSGKGVVRSVRLTGMSVGGLLQAAITLRVSGKITQTFTEPTAA